MEYADDFFDIPYVLAHNGELREAVISLVQSEPMPGKVLEGANRLELFRLILIDLVNGEVGLQDAYLQTHETIPRTTSPHGSSNRVFAKGWAERQVRTQLSRFYNQAVLEKLRCEGAATCFIPHSDAEDATSSCTRLLAGQQQNVDMLYERLVDAYTHENWSRDVKIPNHPHCTHVVKPVHSN